MIKETTKDSSYDHISIRQFDDLRLLIFQRIYQYKVKL